MCYVYCGIQKRYETMSKFKVVEKENQNALHLLTWSVKRGEEWIEKYGDSKMFTDKTLTKESFIVIEDK